jgi:mannose-6-phosphate isomerase-like protein (cupin superfamily)
MAANTGLNMELTSTYLKLRPDASVHTMPVDENFWPKLIAGQLGNFHNEFMVSIMPFDADWPTWEMHPNGDEVVCLLTGAVSFVLEETQGLRTVRLQEAGSFVLVPRGVWHTARTNAPCRMLFITAGEDTQHRAV